MSCQRSLRFWGSFLPAKPPVHPATRVLASESVADQVRDVPMSTEAEADSPGQSIPECQLVRSTSKNLGRRKAAVKPPHLNRANRVELSAACRGTYAIRFCDRIDTLDVHETHSRFLYLCAAVGGAIVGDSVRAFVFTVGIGFCATSKQRFFCSAEPRQSHSLVSFSLWPCFLRRGS